MGSIIAGGKFENGASTAAFGYLLNQVLTTQKSLPLSKGKDLIDKIQEAFNWEENFADGKQQGEAYRQKREDALATMRDRIGKNPDAFTTQQSAQVFREFAIGAAGPWSAAFELASDKNLIKTVPYVKGFVNGYKNCTCVGVVDGN